jgi:hypothetical protein
MTIALRRLAEEERVVLPAVPALVESVSSEEYQTLVDGLEGLWARGGIRFNEAAVSPIDKSLSAIKEFKPFQELQRLTTLRIRPSDVGEWVWAALEDDYALLDQEVRYSSMAAVLDVTLQRCGAGLPEGTRRVIEERIRTLREYRDTLRALHRRLVEAVESIEHPFAPDSPMQPIREAVLEPPTAEEQRRLEYARTYWCHSVTPLFDDWLFEAPANVPTINVDVGSMNPKSTALRYLRSLRRVDRQAAGAEWVGRRVSAEVAFLACSVEDRRYVACGDVAGSIVPPDMEAVRIRFVWPKREVR